MSVSISEFKIEPIDECFYTSLHDNFVCSKYTVKEIEQSLDRLAKKKYVVDTNCPNCGAPIMKSQCEYCGTVFTDLAEQEEEDEDCEPPMIFGNILIPLEDWRVAKEALCDECMLEESEAYRIINLVFDIALCNAEEDKS